MILLKERSIQQLSQLAWSLRQQLLQCRAANDSSAYGEPPARRPPSVNGEATPEDFNRLIRWLLGFSRCFLWFLYPRPPRFSLTDKYKIKPTFFLPCRRLWLQRERFDWKCWERPTALMEIMSKGLATNSPPTHLSLNSRGPVWLFLLRAWLQLRLVNVLGATVTGAAAARFLCNTWIDW